MVLSYLRKNVWNVATHHDCNAAAVRDDCKMKKQRKKKKKLEKKRVENPTVQEFRVNAINSLYIYLQKVITTSFPQYS